MRYLSFGVTCLLTVFVGACTLAQAEEATGLVYEDKNDNGVRDRGERGLADVLVSNGQEIVQTDGSGRYRIAVSDDTVIFVIKPRGWMTPVGPGNDIPRFYYVHKPKGSPTMAYAGVGPTGPLPSSVDFALRREKEGRCFRMLCFGDTQPRDEEEIQFIAHDIVEGLVGTDAAFGITLGDNVFNRLSLFEPLVSMMSQMGIPWRYVQGNHDHNHDAPTEEQTDETFSRFFGPTYYSFNYGAVHFIVLDDIRHQAKVDQYDAGLGERQLAFVANDLSHVSKSQLVVLMMHIPIIELKERAALFALLKDFPHTFSLSAHTHTQRNMFIGAQEGWLQATPHHHLVSATACGSWWGGFLNETGVPMATMSDGAPNGYSIVTFDGNTYRVEFRAAGKPADCQMHIWLPDEMDVHEVSKTSALVNVFAGSSRSTLEGQLDGCGVWTPLTAFRGQDPFYLQIQGREKSVIAAMAKAKGVTTIDDDFVDSVRDELHSVFRRVSRPGTCEHLWRMALPGALAAGTHTLEIRTVDMYGQHYAARRIFVVK